MLCHGTNPTSQLAYAPVSPLSCSPLPGRIRTDAGVLVSHCRVGNVTVTLIVFFGPGRQAIQRIMQCYVERNLVVNGGIVSDVIWQAHDSLGASDLAFLQVQYVATICCESVHTTMHWVGVTDMSDLLCAATACVSVCQLQPESGWQPSAMSSNALVTGHHQPAS